MLNAIQSAAQHTCESANNSCMINFSTGSIRKTYRRKKESGSILEILEEMIVGRTITKGFPIGSTKAEKVIDMEIKAFRAQLEGSDAIPGTHSQLSSASIKIVSMVFVMARKRLLRLAGLRFFWRPTVMEVLESPVFYALNRRPLLSGFGAFLSRDQ
ncbi:hypothetical protein Tco_0195833 [Tanacetum coccineum]